MSEVNQKDIFESHIGGVKQTEQDNKKKSLLSWVGKVTSQVGSIGLSKQDDQPFDYSSTLDG